jgi:hypothetical protein
MASVIPGQGARRPLSVADVLPAAPARQMALLRLGVYLIVGGICFCIGVGGFVALRLLKLPILTASVVSSVTATLVNYLLCCGFVSAVDVSRVRRRSSDSSLLLLLGSGSIPQWSGFWPEFCGWIQRLPKSSLFFPYSHGTISGDAQWCLTEARPLQ